ncbi:MAG: serine/threonine protein kinase [Planctomycetaceae bacterium]|jgi:eukaryotic-like serine/threonine-protein kinase|nr:serine/threonine protein kinase [Planctomycetaceae bacterium]MBT6483044.1 serine/threonine protein kinase [Planctomycetaceae bacterium]MBT6497597.1 serine/threonine protein kinase [Planctomycetaceae bacterium]
MNETHEFDECIRRFEEAWQRGDNPDITKFFSGVDSGSGNPLPSDSLLTEIICIDLEIRWKRRRAERPLIVEDYIARFPMLETPGNLPVEIIIEEYRARHRWGDAPTHEEYTSRFATQRKLLLAEFHRIDRELRDETDDGTLPTIPHVTAEVQGIDPVAPLPYSDYVLQKQIGAGAIGKVYRAHQKSLDRTVVVKYLRKSFARQPHVVERFVTEARTVARFNHPGIVGIHGLGRTPGSGYFIVMEYIEGGDLQAQIESRKVTIRQAVVWTAEACEAIQHAHDRGVVHCDLKPGNLLIGGDGHLRVTDFGMARSMAPDVELPPGIEGTAPYMAPEQISDFWGPISDRTDVYGLGSVLFALLTGRPPHTGKRVGDILTNVISAQSIPSPRDVRPDVTSQLDQICQTCLAKEPTQRFATASELQTALKEWLD